MIIDFTSDKPKITDYKELVWQKEILDFLEKFTSKSNEITVNTSGSTGKPKSYAVSKNKMIASAKMTGDFFGLNKMESALLCLPINYIAGKMMLVRAYTWKLKLHCVEPQTKVISKSEKKIDFAAFTPMQAVKSMSTLNNCNVVLLGGSKVGYDLGREIAKLNCCAYETYGMTETLSHIAIKKIGVKSIFHTLPGVIISKDKRDCLVIKVPFLEDEIVTNDIVKVLNSESFELLGRIDNTINSGGVKLQPEQIERKLKPYIKEDFIISFLDDKLLGQKIVLIVEREEKANELYPKNILSKFENPKSIFFIKKLSRNSNGKIVRSETRKLIV